MIVRYGWAIDTKDWALLDTCFTDDAEVDYSSNPGGKQGPYRQVRSWLEKMLSAFPVTQHLMSNIDVKLDGDYATARTMVTNPQGAATREGPLHFFFVGARYDDDFVRTADGWRIAKRGRDHPLVRRLPPHGADPHRLRSVSCAPRRPYGPFPSSEVEGQGGDVDGTTSLGIRSWNPGTFRVARSRRGRGDGDI